MADSDTIYSLAGVTVGEGRGFQLTLRRADGTEQRFDCAIDDIPALVQGLTAVAWASAATNRPPAGTKLPEINAFPVKKCEVGTVGGSPDPVLAIELHGGVRLGLHFTVDNAKSTANWLAQAAGLPPIKIS